MGWAESTRLRRVVWGKLRVEVGKWKVDSRDSNVKFGFEGLRSKLRMGNRSWKHNLKAEVERRKLKFRSDIEIGVIN